jgi:NADH-quinone oxidoreductase subunit J
MELFVFYLFALVAVVSALLVVVLRNPIYCALSLVATFFSLAGLFVLLEAYFLAAVQVIVYAGAIMVLFLFVIMLLNLGRTEALEPSAGKYRKLSVILLMIVFAWQIASMAGRGAGRAGGAAATNSELFENNVPYIGRLLYTDFFLPFEIVSMILLVALVGVIVLVKRDKERAGEEEAA